MQAFLPSLFFDPEDGSGFLPPKCQLASNGPHGVISQKTELSIKMDGHSDRERNSGTVLVTLQMQHYGTLWPASCCVTGFITPQS
jgi:hypothetical protein